MRQQNAFSSATILLALSYTCVYAQTSGSMEMAKPKGATAHIGYYFDPSSLQLGALLPSPPAADSSTTKDELNELHHIEATRTAALVARAQADDQEEDIFIYKLVLGSGFTAEALPLTAALSSHIRKDESAAGGGLKSAFHRPRPYQADVTLHPVCALTKEPNSYPSGHSLSGYLLAFTLIQMVPEKRDEILQRANEYAHSRLVCGVHYASDIAASRDIAYAVFGSISASPVFQKDLAAARAETRKKLGLP